MRMNIKAAVATAAVAGVLAACGGTASAPKVTTVKAAFSELTVSQAPMWVAKDQGFFTQQGIDLQLEQATGPAQVASITAGELQFASVGAPEVMSADLNGGSIALLASASDIPFNSVYADKSVKQFIDLAGKAIAVPQKGAISETWLRLVIDYYGLAGRIDVTALGSVPAVLAGLQSGQVIAGVLSPPATGQAAQAGFVELVNGFKLNVPYANSSVAATRSYIKSNPDVVRRFLTAYQQGWTYIANPANKATVVDVLARNQKVSADVAQAGYEAAVQAWTSKQVPRVNPEGVANALKYVDAPNAKGADPSQFIDNSFWDQVPTPSPQK